MRLVKYVIRRAARSFGLFLLGVLAVSILVYLPCFIWGASPLGVMLIHTLVRRPIDWDLYYAMYANFGLVPNPDNWDWLVIIWATFTNCIHGEMGLSRIYMRPVSALLGERVSNTLLLFVVSAFLASVQLRRRKRGKPRSSSEPSGRPSLLSSVPVFWPAMMLVMTFSYIIPEWTGHVSGIAIGMPEYGTISYYVWEAATQNWTGAVLVAGDVLLHLALPAAVLSSFMTWSLVSILDQGVSTGEDTASVLATLSEHREEVARAIPPILSALILVEIAFRWTGVGFFLFHSILLMDTPAVLGCLVSFIGIAVFSACLIEISGALVVKASRSNEGGSEAEPGPSRDEVAGAVRAYLLGILPPDLDVTRSLPVRRACSIPVREG